MSKRLAGWLAAAVVLLGLGSAADPGAEFPEGDGAETPTKRSSGLHVVPPIPPGPPPTGALPADLADAARDARLLPLGERLRAVSEPMLGRPYAIDPLGEGDGVDPDPIARYDVFDCLTFVEEVLALALSADPTGAADVRRRLRYGDGHTEYARRRHFMELQWIPGNVADGWLVDTTAEYGPTVRQEREVTREMWQGWGRRQLFALTPEQLPTGTMRLDVLPLQAAIEAAPRIRPGSLILTVRADRAWKPMWTTHIGFVVAGEQPMMRNATRRTSMRVVDESLVWYLEHLKNYKNWPATGIAILEPIEQGPRLAALPASAP